MKNVFVNIVHSFFLFCFWHYHSLHYGNTWEGMSLLQI
jgi:hypothetical protein